MKKIYARIILAVTLFLVLLLPAIALAEEAGAIEDGATPITWGYVGTIAGATAVTLLVVQFLKVPLDRVWKIPTRFVVYGVAAILMIAAKAFTTGIATLNDVLLILTNAFIVATSAYGAYEISFKKLE